MIIKTLESRPEDATHWSTRSMAREAGVTAGCGDADLARVRAAAPPPGDLEALQGPAVHREGPRHLRPVPQPARTRGGAVRGRKIQIQALDRTAPTLPMLPGHPRARDPRLRAQRHDQPVRRAEHPVRRSHRLAAPAPPRDRVPEVPQDHRRRTCPPHLDVHLVLDNASSHKTPAVRRWLAQHPRFVLHFTPTSSSWINLVERWFSELTTKLLRRGAHRSVRAAQHRHPPTGSTPGTRTPARTSGPRPPSRSSTQSNATANELTRQRH